MRKFLTGLLLGCLFLSCPVNILAEATAEPASEEIQDAETPQNNRRRQQDMTMILAFCAAGILLLIGASAATKKKDLQLFVEHIDSNGDGSYTVTWGYKNPTHSGIKFNEDEAGLKIRKGTAIVLKRPEPTEFEPGTHKEAIITVINDETEIEWIAGRQKVSVNGQLIKQERRDENETI